MIRTKRSKIWLACLTALALAAAGCGGSGETTAAETTAQETASQAEPSEENASESTDSGESQAASGVASEGETVEAQEVVEEGMSPITGDQLRDGTYSVTVDSSSSMFNVVSCELTVSQGQMTAVMTMSGTGYLYVYMGTGEEAAAASQEDYISYTENADGSHSFTVPVEALDAGIPCAAFSRNKEQWYDRTLLFRADSLPLSALGDGLVTTPESLGLADGEYRVDVELGGGSGRAGVESPAALYVENGQVTATIAFSSSNYDYMLVEDVRYDAEIVEDRSTFTIPVACFDWKMPVVADTIAMSVPHEVSYTLHFDSASIVPAEEDA